MSDSDQEFVLLWRGESAGLPCPLDELAEALASSPIWGRMEDACLVLRSGSDPVLAALGRFDEADRHRLRFLARWLPEGVETSRRFSWSEVETGVTELARVLQDTLGEELHDHDVAGIPRGGLIVTGLLAYAAEIRAERCDPSTHDPGRPLLVVDDCALTGNRFARSLAAAPERTVVFAQLCSPAPLRRAIREAESRVRAVIAPIDLEDRTRTMFGDEAGAWRSQLRARLGDDRYWIGSTERPVFPWSEPDLNFWNPMTGEEESGWSLFSPGRRLKPSSSERASGRVPVLTSPEPVGDFRVPSGFLSADRDDRVHLVELDTGRTLELDRIASEIFRGLVGGHSVRSIAGAIAGRHDEVSPEHVLDDVECFRREACEMGILTPVDDGRL